MVKILEKPDPVCVKRPYIPLLLWPYKKGLLLFKYKLFYSNFLTENKSFYPAKVRHFYGFYGRRRGRI